jgi:hypothetical protein
MENETNSQETQNPNQDSPKNLLFGTISYVDDAAYETFLNNLNINHSIFLLIAAANFAQAKGAFSIQESETLARAVRLLKNNSSQKDQESK